MSVRCNRATGAACESRRTAQRAGEMYFSVRHNGWIYPADERAVPRVLREKSHAPFCWTFCPFCQQPLPDVVSGFEHGLAEPWKDAADGETGG